MFDVLFFFFCPLPPAPCPMPSRSLRLLFLLSTLAMAFLYGRIDHTVEPFSQWDLTAYSQMAEAAPGLAGDVVQPFSRRILGPWLAGMMPLSVPDSFYLLSLLASLTLVWQMSGWMLQSDADPRIVALIVFAFICNRYLFGFTLWNPFQLNDLLSLNAILWSFRCLYRKQWAFLALSLVLGVLCREVSLLILPAAAVYRWETRTIHTQAKALFVACLPCILVFAFLQLAIPSTGGLNFMEALQRHSPKFLSPSIWTRVLFNAFLPFCFLPLVFCRKSLTFFRAHLHLIVFGGLVLASTFFGTNNERLMAPAFLVFYPLLSFLLKDLRLQNREIALLGFAAFLASFHHLYGRWPLPDRNLTLALSLLTTGLVTASLVTIWGIRKFYEY